MSIASEKRKLSHAVFVFVRFPNLGMNLSSKSATITFNGSDVDFDEVLRRKGIGAISYEVPEAINGLSSVSTATVYGVAYRDVLRSGLIENGGTSIIGEAAEIYFKFNDGDDSDTASLLLLSGEIRDFTVSDDVVNIRVESISYSGLGLLPLTTIRSWYSLNNQDNSYAVPIQFGDFNWASDPRWFAERSGVYAASPYAFFDESENVHVFTVSGHFMDEMPSGGSGTYDWNDAGDSYLFIYRDNKLVHVQSIGGRVENDEDIGEVRIPPQGDAGVGTCFVWLHPQTHIDGEYENSALNPINAYDGNSGSVSRLAATNPTLNLTGFDVQFSENEPLATQLYVYVADLEADGGNPIATVLLKRKSDNAVIETFTSIFSGDSGWVALGSITSINLDVLNDHYIEFRCATAGNTLQLAAVCLRINVQPFTLGVDEPVIYVRCKGRMYSDTWDTRKTTGNLITNPIDTLECLMREVLGISVRTGEFDTINQIFSGAASAYSIIEQRKVSEFLNEFCEALNLSAVLHPSNELGLIMADHSQSFTYSNNSTAQNADIFTDIPSVLNGTFVQCPIAARSLEITRTAKKDAYGTVTTLYHRLADGTFLSSYSKTDGSGGNIEAIIENRFLKQPSHIQVLTDNIHAWRSKTHLIASFESFFDVIDIEVGYIVQVRHTDFSTNLIGESQTAAKWILVAVSKNIYGGKIKIKAIHIPTTAAMGSF